MFQYYRSVNFLKGEINRINESREDVQRLRAESSAILTGIGTVLADDPSMTVRSEQYKEARRQPERVILDSHLKMPETAKMLSLSGQTVILSAKTLKIDIDRGMRLGADDYVIKPFSVAELVIKVKKSLKNKINVHKEFTCP